MNGWMDGWMDEVRQGSKQMLAGITLFFLICLLIIINVTLVFHHLLCTYIFGELKINYALFITYLYYTVYKRKILMNKKRKVRRLKKKCRNNKEKMEKKSEN